ncbi:MAG: type IV pili twitching motility protein PilT, partial [Candidatus Hydrogenedentes bacterium]|nr:type IV pili twitching motility protein PilT [Candidatus Hydrogenedentota bacterium]
MASTMEELMRGALEQNASDIHLKAGNPPIYRIDGELHRLEEESLTEE